MTITCNQTTEQYVSKLSVDTVHRSTSVNLFQHCCIDYRTSKWLGTTLHTLQNPLSRTYTYTYTIVHLCWPFFFAWTNLLWCSYAHHATVYLLVTATTATAAAAAATAVAIAASTRSLQQRVFESDNDNEACLRFAEYRQFGHSCSTTWWVDLWSQIDGWSILAGIRVGAFFGGVGGRKQQIGDRFVRTIGRERRLPTAWFATRSWPTSYRLLVYKQVGLAG